MNNNELTVLAGRFFLFGFAGTKVDETIKQFISADKISGVILFKRNIESLEQVTDLNKQLQNLSSGKLLIAVDEEGGRVSRLPLPFQKLPSMRDIALNLTEEEAYNQAKNLAITLKSFGFNINFAPVLDIDTNPNNPVIANRSFGNNVEIVNKYSSQFIKGFKDGGILSCGKHFPGHGDTLVDSHKDLPVNNDTIESLKERELLTFKHAIECGIDSIMSAHILFKNIDEYPATLSKTFLTNTLKDYLNFKGVLFSDDMDMNAMKDKYSIQDMVYKGIESGIDIFIVSKNDYDMQTAMIAYTKELIAKGEISIERLLESSKKIDKMLNKI